MESRRTLALAMHFREPNGTVWTYIMTARIGLARYSAKEALRIILDESDDSTDNDNDSVSENDDHVSEYSEHSDVESVDDEVDIGAQCLPAPANSGQNSLFQLEQEVVVVVCVVEE